MNFYLRRRIKSVKDVMNYVLVLFVVVAISCTPTNLSHQTVAHPTAKKMLTKIDGNFSLQSLPAFEPPTPQFDIVNQTPFPTLFELQFQSKQQSKQKIQIPEQGSFKLTIEASTHYQILDRDATDGHASITVPANQLHDFYLRIKKPFDNPDCQGKNNKSPECQTDADNAKLILKDNLYMINQTLKPSIGETWIYGPRRPLPVPADWYSPDQSKYVLEFENHGVKGFMSRWFKGEGQAAFPVSVKVIPRIDCVQENLDGTHTAYLGYDNQMPGTVTIPTGEANFFTPSHSQLLQSFVSGSSQPYPESAYVINFVGSSLTWALNQRQVTVNANDATQVCPQETLIVDQHTPVRKYLIEPQTISIQTGNQAQVIIPFEVQDASDLKRRILVNLFQGSQHVESAEVVINGNSLFPHMSDQNMLNQNMPSMIAQAFGSIHPGANQLTLKLTGPIGSSVRLSLDAFMIPVDIPNALHSRLSRFSFEEGVPIIKGRLRLKFTEGMKVRLQSHPDISKRLVDQSGISLFPLEHFIKIFEIQDIQPTHTRTSEEEDLDEAQREQAQGIEIPNRNLDYDFYFDESKDVWQMVKILREFPFVEESTAEFDGGIGPAYRPNEDSKLGPCDFTNDILLPLPEKKCIPGTPYSKNQWLINTRIMNGNFTQPDLLPGAWDVTTGNPTIKVFNLEGAYDQLHEDLGNIHYISNVLNSHSVIDQDHATNTLGVLGATANNNKGIAGVAHGASIYHIESYGVSACRGGTGFLTSCVHTVDSLELARKNGANVILIENWDPFMGTVEQQDYRVRDKITQLVEQGITIIVPGGNQACTGYNNSYLNPSYDYIAECERNFPDGRDIRQIPIINKIHIPISHPNSWIIPPPLFGGLVPVVSSLFNWVEVKEIRSFVPMTDTGSIIVGGLKLNGSRLEDGFNYGRTIFDTTHSTITSNGHGIDIGAPAEAVWTSVLSNNNHHIYGSYNGTSAASPVVAGVATLMLSQNPNLSPLEIRRILNQTQQTNLLPGADSLTAGMIDAYEAVCKANPATPACSAGTGEFSKSSLSESIPENAPPTVSLWLFREGSKIVVEPDQEVGVGINYPDLSGVDIQIDGQSMPIRQLANNYLTFGIPTDMTPGVKDVIIKLAGGIVTLEQALEVIALADLPQVSFTIPENTIYSNGSFWKDVYATIRDAQGKTLPAGRPIYVSGLATPSILSSNHQLMDPVNNKLWTHEGLFYTDANGQIHLKYKVNTTVQASQYGEMWPTPTSPNTRFRICNYTYRSSKPGWGGDCLKQLFPASTEASNEGRIFWVGPASARIEPSHMDMLMNGSSYAMSITDVRDKAGNIVPDGTSVYLAYPYWITTGSGGLITPEEGQSNYIQSGGGRFARLVVRGGRANFTLTTRSVACWGGNEVTRDSLILVGTFNSSIGNPLNRIATGTIQYLTQLGC